MKGKIFLSLFSAGIFLFACNNPKTDTPAVETPKTEVPPPQPEQMAEPEPLKVDDSATATHRVVINTGAGAITAELFGMDAPKTVENFVGLAKKNYYNGILFHRVAKGFVIQAGDPKSKDPNKRNEWGTGGESFWGNGFEDELNPNAPSYKKGYVRGTLAMANHGPNTNGSQFFILTGDAPQLPKNYTIFGHVVSGMDVVDKIGTAEIEPGPMGGEDGTPKKPVAIKNIKVEKLEAKAADMTPKK